MGPETMHLLDPSRSTCWKHMTGNAIVSTSRQCWKEEESSDDLWLRCLAFMLHLHDCQLGDSLDELINQHDAMLTLLRIISRRIGWITTAIPANYRTTEKFLIFGYSNLSQHTNNNNNNDYLSVLFLKRAHNPSIK